MSSASIVIGQYFAPPASPCLICLYAWSCQYLVNQDESRSNRNADPFTAVRLPARYRAGGRRNAAYESDGSAAIAASEDCSRVHRLCQGQSRKGNDGIIR